MTINTGANTGASFFGGNGDWTQGGGAVSVIAGNAGGAYLDSLSVNTVASGAHNHGVAGAITLNGVATSGAQNYVGGATAIAGDLATNGGNIDLSGVASVTVSAGTEAISTDMAGGSGAAGHLLLGANVLNGAGALSIDTTADGGGASANLSLNAIGDDVSLASLRVKADSVALAGAIRVGGDIAIESTALDANLVLDHTLASINGNIALATGAHFVNNVGGGLFSPGEAKHWQVWSAAPTGDTQGGLLSDFKQYNAHYGAATVLGAGNGFLYVLAPTVTANLGGTISKVYDGNHDIALSGANFSASGAIDGDVVLLSSPETGHFDNVNAGLGKLLSADGVGVASASNGAQAVYGYQVLASTVSTDTGVITPKALTLTGMSAVNRVYDGGTAATLAGGALSGLVGAETLTISGAAVFDNKNAGLDKAVKLDGLGLANGSGAHAGLAANYSLAPLADLSANITARALTVTASGVSRVYDGGVSAGVTLADNRVEGDQLTVLKDGASFSNKNVGLGKSVGVAGIHLSGADAGNYSVNATASTTADITARALTVTAAGVNRVYDGGVLAGATLADNRVEGDQFGVAGSASFADKNVGAGKAVGVAGIHLSGTDAGNYSVNTTAATTADITARALTVTASGVNRVYDGGVLAGVTLADNRVAGDQFGVAAGASFGDKNVGAGKAVGVAGIHLSGLDAGNYSVNATAATTADITARALTVTAAGVSRVYDGGVLAGVTLTDNRLEGDQFGAAGNASFSDKNVGAGKVVGVAGIHLSGLDAGNYSVNATAATTADISVRALTVTASGVNRVYDGGVLAGVTLADNRVQGDQLLAVTGAASFADKNVGVGKAVSVSGIVLSGADAGNYSVNATAATTADITPRALLVGATGLSKLVDGNTGATVVLNDNRVAGDTLTLASGGASYADAAAGKDKAVSVTGIKVGGIDAGNYVANDSAKTTADIVANADLGDIVTTIVNHNSMVETLPPKVTADILGQPGVRADSTLAPAGFAVTPQMPLALNAGFGQGTLILAVMAPTDGAPGQRISGEGMRQLVRPDGDGTIRIPLSRNSLAAVVDGGVRLPDGVTQDFFITPSK